ncbi:hypothetical protein [Niveispirillum sp. KHB5.9]|uniref:hypothetical protein n=1 Tax=Niveispirillum sp. KHB5.9 TaxID=3400269 RepID=UPI003A86FFED
MTRPLPHNAILAWSNCLPAATLTGSWTGINNLKTWFLGEEAVTGTAGAGPHVITATWAAEQAIDLVMILGHNLLEDGTTIRVQLYNGATLIHDSTAMPAYVPAPIGYIPWGDNRFWGHMLGPWDRRWGLVLDELLWITKAVITITAAGLDGVAVSLPILYVGPSWQVQANYDRGSAAGLHGAADVQGADFGVPQPDDDPMPRTFNCTLSHLTEGEVRARLRELLAHTGRGKLPFLLLPEPGDAFGIMTQTMLAFLPDTPRVVRSTTRKDEFVMDLDAREWLA